MRLTTPLLSLAVLVLAGATASPAAARCHAGTHRYGGATAQTFCGPAKASVAMPSRNVSFHQGRCDRTHNYLTVNIGTIVLGDPPRNRPPYFGITVGKTAFGGSPASKDGTYSKNVVISWVTGGKSYSVAHAKLKLAGHRTRGTFTGVLLTGDNVSGSFHC